MQNLGSNSLFREKKEQWNGLSSLFVVVSFSVTVVCVVATIFCVFAKAILLFIDKGIVDQQSRPEKYRTIRQIKRRIMPVLVVKMQKIDNVTVNQTIRHVPQSARQNKAEGNR